MITDLFKSLIHGIGAIGGKILGMFATVTDAVVGLQITGLCSLLGALVSGLTNMICGAMSYIGSSTISLFEIDIGTGQSIFEIIFSSFENVFTFTRALALSLLLLIVITNLLKIMCSPGPVIQTPASLLVHTFIAGILIYLGPHLVIIAEDFFNSIYKVVLGMCGFSDIDYQLFFKEITELVSEDKIFISASVQIKSLVLCTVNLIIMLIIGGRFIAYMFEVIQRYVVLGVLVMTSPLGFALYASKSTRNSFVSWLRMLGSTLFLMITNVAFLGLFFRGMSSFGDFVNAVTASDDFVNSSKTALLFCWGLLLYGILYIGGKLDTYLNAIGFSTAETGASMMSSMMAEMIDSGAINPLAALKLNSDGVISSKMGPAVKAFSPILTRFIGTPEERKMKEEQSEPGANRIKFDFRTGFATADSINKCVANMKENDASLGKGASNIDGRTITMVGSGVISSLRGIPGRYLNKLAPQSCIIQSNRIHLESTSDAQGKKMALDLVPKKVLDDNPTMYCSNFGREVSLGDTKYVAFASGKGAREFYGYNPAAKFVFQERFPDGSVYPIKSRENTGAFRKVDEDKSSGVKTVYEWVPASCYPPDMTLHPTLENIGGMDYWAYKVRLPLDYNGENTGLCGTKPGHVNSGKWLKQEFPDLYNEGYRCSGFCDAGLNVAVLYNMNETYLLAPSSLYTTKPDGNGNLQEPDILQTSASNGADYFIVKIDAQHGDTLIDFIQERNPQDEPYTKQNMFSMSFTSNILKASFEKSRLNKGGKN